MIIPSGVTKIIGFKKKYGGERFPEPVEGANIMSLQLDNGQVIDMKIFSNDKEFSDSLGDFLISKAQSVLKENEVKQGAYDLTFDTEGVFAKQIADKQAEILANEPNLAGPALMQRVTMEVSKDLVFNKRMIKQRSIIKLPIAIGKSQDGGSYYTSRSIQVALNDKGEKGFGRGGIYYFAQSSNNVPIEITPIRNKEGSFVGYFKVTTAKLINAEQIDFLIDHSIRTVNHLFSVNKKPFLIQMIKNEVSKTVPGELLNLFKELNNIEKMNRDSQNPLSKEVYDNYVSILENLKSLMQATPAYYKFFKASLPLVIPEERMKKFIFEVDKEAGKSSLQRMSQAITSLNFSRENPNVKSAVTKMIQQYVGSIHTGEVSSKILTNINFKAPNLFGQVDTWGFPVENIAAAKFTLSYNDTFALIQQAYSHADQMKNQGGNF